MSGEKRAGVRVAVGWDAHWEWRGDEAVPLPQRIFFEFSSKKIGLLCIFYCEKLYTCGHKPGPVGG